MGVLATLGGLLGGPIKDLTETRKATKAAKLDHKLKLLEAQTKLKVARLEAEATIAIKQAEHEANWEMEAVRQAGTSWKDEYWTIVLSLPLIAVFLKPLQEAVLDGFTALEQVPLWYQAAIMAALSFAFGLRALNKFTNWKKDKSNG